MKRKLDGAHIIVTALRICPNGIKHHKAAVLAMCLSEGRFRMLFANKSYDSWPMKHSERVLKMTYFEYCSGPHEVS